MSKFDDYVKEVMKNLPTSRPIFTAALDPHSIDFTVKERIFVGTADYPDPIDKVIVNEANYERLRYDSDDWTKTRFTRGCETSQVYMKIHQVVKAVYECNSGLKNPRQSRTYKWLETMYSKYNHESCEGFVLLYRYIAKHADLSRSSYKGHLPKVYADNVIHVLEKMRNKYENE